MVCVRQHQLATGDPNGAERGRDGRREAGPGVAPEPGRPSRARRGGQDGGADHPGAAAGFSMSGAAVSLCISQVQQHGGQAADGTWHACRLRERTAWTQGLMSSTQGAKSLRFRRQLRVVSPSMHAGAASQFKLLGIMRSARWTDRPRYHFMKVPASLHQQCCRLSQR